MYISFSPTIVLIRHPPNSSSGQRASKSRGTAERARERMKLTTLEKALFPVKGHQDKPMPNCAQALCPQLPALFESPHRLPYWTAVGGAPLRSSSMAKWMDVLLGMLALERRADTTHNVGSGGLRSRGFVKDLRSRSCWGPACHLRSG